MGGRSRRIGRASDGVLYDRRLDFEGYLGRRKIPKNHGGAGVKPKQLVRIREGWMDAGKVGLVIGESPMIDGVCYWTPVIFMGDDDPTFFKTRALETFEPAGQFKSFRSRVNFGISSPPVSDK